MFLANLFFYRELEDEIHSFAISHPHALNIDQCLPIIFV
jgi:hypothetical protein